MNNQLVLFMKKKVLQIMFVLVSITCYAQSRGFSGKQHLVTPSTAMKNYLSLADRAYSWQVKDTIQLDGVTAYLLNLTSQQWRDTKWKHNLAVLVPDTIAHNGSLLFISGGKIKDGEPVFRDLDQRQMHLLSPLAKANKAVAAILWQVPNQPLYNDLTEDALISFTLHNYLEDNDFTWPLLFPMTKSAVRAMDAVQEFAKTKLDHPVDSFTVSGFSKRGWTTWLTGANDPRAEAIAPMVIDVLNMPVNVDYQVKAWGDYSIEIQDYVNLGIAQKIGTKGGNELVRMIDPYSYRSTLTMPKMIFMGTNDPYWPVDAVKNYIDSIPGENYIHYVPNVGHDLGDKQQAYQALSAFWENTLTDRNYPECHCKYTQEGGNLTLTLDVTADKLSGVQLWTALSDDRDFRDNEFKSEGLEVTGKEKIFIAIPLPDSGFKAAYLDLEYTTSEGKVFTQSTRAFVLTAKGLTDRTDQDTR